MPRTLEPDLGYASVGSKRLMLTSRSLIQIGWLVFFWILQGEFSYVRRLPVFTLSDD